MGSSQSRAHATAEDASIEESHGGERQLHPSPDTHQTTTGDLSFTGGNQEASTSRSLLSSSSTSSVAGSSRGSLRRKRKADELHEEGEQQRAPQRRRLSSPESSGTRRAGEADERDASGDSTISEAMSGVQEQSSARRPASRSLRSRLRPLSIASARDVFRRLRERRVQGRSSNQAGGEVLPRENASTTNTSEPGRELSPDQLEEERARAIAQISNVLGSAAVRRRSRDDGDQPMLPATQPSAEGLPATASSSSTPASAQAQPQVSATRSTANNASPLRTLPQLLNGLLRPRRPNTQAGNAEQNAAPGNVAIDRSNLSAGTYVVVQGMLVARNSSSPEPSSSSTSRSATAGPSSNTPTSSTAESATASTPRVTRARARSMSGVASSPGATDASDQSATQHTPSTNQTTERTSSDTQAPRDSGPSDLRVPISPPTTASEQSAMLTRMIAIATAATAVSLMEPSSAVQRAAAQGNSPAAAAAPGGTGGEAGQPAQTDASAASSQGGTASASASNGNEDGGGGEGARPRGPASDLRSMLSSVLSARPGSNTRLQPLTSQGSAPTTGTETPAWTIENLNETLSRVRAGNIRDGAPHTFEHFLHALAEDLGAAIQTAYGSGATGSLQQPAWSRRRRDVTGGNVTFFRMFRFEDQSPRDGASSTVPALLQAQTARQQAEAQTSAGQGAQTGDHTNTNQQQTNQRNGDNQRLLPCLVVGIRSHPLDPWNPFGIHFTPGQAAPSPTASPFQARGPTVSPTNSAAGSTAPENNRSESSSNDTQPRNNSTPSDTPIRYSLFISGGYYAEDHPLLTHPLHIAARDLMVLMETLAAFTAFQTGRSVATSEDIEKSDTHTLQGRFLQPMFEEGKVSESTKEKCLICLEDWQSEDMVRILKCKHAYHTECVDRWLCTSSNTCPLCRREAVKTSGSTSAPQPNPTATL